MRGGRRADRQGEWEDGEGWGRTSIVPSGQRLTEACSTRESLARVQHDSGAAP